MSYPPEVPSREQIKIGQQVWAIEKKNYGTGELTAGKVARILTSKPSHSRGIKVMFENGTVARVQRITPPPKEAGIKPELPTEEDII